MVILLLSLRRLGGLCCRRLVVRWLRLGWLLLWFFELLRSRSRLLRLRLVLFITVGRLGNECAARLGFLGLGLDLLLDRCGLFGSLVLRFVRGRSRLWFLAICLGRRSLLFRVGFVSSGRLAILGRGRLRVFLVIAGRSQYGGDVATWIAYMSIASSMLCCFGGLFLELFLPRLALGEVPASLLRLRTIPDSGGSV